MDRPQYDEDGNFIYYASEFGSCTKALIAKRMGYAPKATTEAGSQSGDRLRRVFEEGHLHEESMIKAYERLKSVHVFNKEQLIVHHFGVPGTIVHGHIDGETMTSVLENKTMGQDSFDKVIKTGWDTPGFVQKYKWQTSLYGWIKEKPVDLFIKNRNNGSYHLLSMPTPWYTFDSIQTRILEIETAAELGELPRFCDNQMFPCPYEYLHEEEKVIRKDGEVDLYAKMYLDANKSIKDWEERKAEARLVLEEALGDADKLETIGGTRIVRYAVGKQRSDEEVRVDASSALARLKEEWGEDYYNCWISEFSTTIQPGQRPTAIRVTLRKSDGD